MLNSYRNYVNMNTQLATIIHSDTAINFSHLDLFTGLSADVHHKFVRQHKPWSMCSLESLSLDLCAFCSRSIYHVLLGDQGNRSVVFAEQIRRWNIDICLASCRRALCNPSMGTKQFRPFFPVRYIMEEMENRFSGRYGVTFHLLNY